MSERETLDEKAKPHTTPEVDEDVERAARQRGRLPIDDSRTAAPDDEPESARERLKRAADLNDAEAAHRAHGEGNP